MNHVLAHRCVWSQKFVCLEVLKHLALWATHAVGVRLVWVWEVEFLWDENKFPLQLLDQILLVVVADTIFGSRY